MGKVYTTSEDLTSVANAIRAKSGSNSSLVYPSGFVNEIGNITTGSNDVYDGIGKNPVLLYTYNQSLKLSDTDWSNITLKSSNQTIVANNTLSDEVRINDNDYSYVIIFNGYVNYQYLDNTAYPRMLEHDSIQLITRVRTASSSVNFSDLSEWNGGVLTQYSVSDYRYATDTTESASGTSSGSSVGITFGTAYPSWTPNVLSSIKTPPIRAALNQYYFVQAAADAIDINNTQINYTIKVYQYDKNSLFTDAMNVNLLNYRSQQQS